MEEWFYVKNDLSAREDIKEVIMRPIWSRFGLRSPKVEIDDAAEACQKAFSTVFSFIGMRDLIQEHIAFRVWPLVESWENKANGTSSVSSAVSLSSYLYAQCAPNWRAPSVIDCCYSSKGKVFFRTFGLRLSSMSQSEFVILTN